MTEDVLYTARWNGITRRPVADYEWLDAAGAEELYSTGSGLEVVEAANLDAEGVPRPRWVIGLGASGRVRVRFFDKDTTLWRLVDWDNVNGRLWRWITYDYTYPSSDQQWSEKDSVLTEKASVQSDGTGYVVSIDKTTKPGRRLKTEFTNRGLDAYWIDYPRFGEWAELIEPGPSAYEVAGTAAPAGAS